MGDLRLTGLFTFLNGWPSAYRTVGGVGGLAREPVNTFGGSTYSNSPKSVHNRGVIELFGGVFFCCCFAFLTFLVVQGLLSYDCVRSPPFFSLINQIRTPCFSRHKKRFLYKACEMVWSTHFYRIEQLWFYKRECTSSGMFRWQVIQFHRSEMATWGRNKDTICFIQL